MAPMGEIVEQRVTFPSAGRPAFVLEGALAGPARENGPAPAGRAVAVLLHPQPASSSMDEPLIRQLAYDLARAGLLALRFNFRGVGASQGQQSDGRLEPLDVAGAIEFALNQPGANAEKLCLIGEAFGAYIALVYAEHDARVRTVVAISPPAFRVTPELGRFPQPKLFVTGEYDEVSPRHKLVPWIDQLPGGRALRVVTGARHLMRGYEPTASETVVNYCRKWAMTPGV